MLVWPFKSKLFKKRTLSYITRHPIWHTTIFRSTRERDQLLVHHILFYVSHLTKSKDDDTQALKKTFFLTSWGRKKKTGTGEFKFHTFIHALVTKAAHTKFTIIVGFVIFFDGEKILFRGTLFVFQKEKVNGDRLL